MRRDGRRFLEGRWLVGRRCRCRCCGSGGGSRGGRSAVVVICDVLLVVRVLGYGSIALVWRFLEGKREKRTEFVPDQRPSSDTTYTGRDEHARGVAALVLLLLLALVALLAVGIAVASAVGIRVLLAGGVAVVALVVGGAEEATLVGVAV